MCIPKIVSNSDRIVPSMIRTNQILNDIHFLNLCVLRNFVAVNGERSNFPLCPETIWNIPDPYWHIDETISPWANNSPRQVWWHSLHTPVTYNGHSLIFKRESDCWQRTTPVACDGNVSTAGITRRLQSNNFIENDSVSLWSAPSVSLTASRTFKTRLRLDSSRERLL